MSKRNKRRAAYIPRATYFGKRTEEPKRRSRAKRKFFQKPELNHLVVIRSLPELLAAEAHGLPHDYEITGWSKLNHRGQLPPGGTPDVCEKTKDMTDEELLAAAAADAEAWEKSKKGKQ